MVTLGMVLKGWSLGSGSTSKTSNAAMAGRPCLSAASRSASLINADRDVFTIKASLRILASALASIMLRVVGAKTMCKDTTLDSASN